MAEEEFDLEGSRMSDSFLKEFGLGKKVGEVKATDSMEMSGFSESFVVRNRDLFEQATGKSAEISLSLSGDGSAIMSPGGIFFHYQIEKKLGSGGMGEVHKAVDLKNNRVVAIKTLKVRSKSANERFRREYEFLSRVDHPNLIKAYDFRETKKELFLIMEFVEGKSLKELIERGENYSFVDKLAIGCQIAQGVYALNLAGIIHRDIKPANIMVNSKEGIVKILDLGLSKDTHGNFDNELTVGKQIVGTCFYMAPEQTEGQVSTTTDIFALGTVLWEWFSGSKESPFFADNQYGAFIKIMTHEPVPLMKFLPRDARFSKVYQHLSNMVATAMEKEPEKRVAHAGIIAKELLELHQYMITHVQEVSQYNWRETSMTKEMEQSLARATVAFRDQDVSLSGELKLSGIMEKGTNGNITQSGITKTAKLAGRRRVAEGRHVRTASTGMRREDKETKMEKKKREQVRNLLVLAIVLVVSAIGGLWYVVSTETELYKIPTEERPLYLKAREHMKRGHELVIENKLEEAIKAFEEAIKTYDKYKEAYISIGDIYLFYEDYIKALDKYTLVLNKIDKEYAPAYLKRGRSYMGLKNWNKAIDEFTKAIEYDPNYIEAYKDRSMAYRNRGDATQNSRDYEKAIKDYEKQKKMKTKKNENKKN